MRALRPYPSYKESASHWLKQVPAHWKMRRLKTLCSMKSGDSITAMSIEPTGQYPVYGGNGIRGYTSSYTHNGQQVLIGRQGALCGNIHIARGQYWASEHAIVATLQPGHVLEWFSSILGVMNLNQHSIAAAQPGLSVERILDLWLPVPPSQEQLSIARFLNHADGRIRRYIRAKEKLIALLEEQKQAVIHQAVTGRIDVRTGQPYLAYKPSGVEWLGDVPVQWGVVALQRVTLERCDGPFGSGLKSSHYTGQGIRVIRLQNIGHGEFNDSDAAYISASHYATLGDHSVKARDVLIAGLGDPNHPAGRACVAPPCIEPAMVKADCFRFRVNTNLIDPAFVSLQLTSTAGTASAILSTGATRQRINLQTTSARLIAIPSLREQSAIVECVRARICQIKDAQRAVEKETALLHEYRTRLIADVVTGKLDVREAVAALPEESDEPDAVRRDGAGVEGIDDGRADGGWRREARATRMEMTS